MVIFEIRKLKRTYTIQDIFGDIMARFFFFFTDVYTWHLQLFFNYNISCTNQNPVLKCLSQHPY